MEYNDVVLTTQIISIKNVYIGAVGRLQNKTRQVSSAEGAIR